VRCRCTLRSRRVQTPHARLDQAGLAGVRTRKSYREVVNIIGREGEELSSSEIAGIRAVMYSWKSDIPGDIGNMNVMFQNDELIQKAQFGLK
jgi:hypothetical protein